MRREVGGGFVALLLVVEEVGGLMIAGGCTCTFHCCCTCACAVGACSMDVWQCKMMRQAAATNELCCAGALALVRHSERKRKASKLL